MDQWSEGSMSLIIPEIHYSTALVHSFQKYLQKSSIFVKIYLTSNYFSIIFRRL